MTYEEYLKLVQKRITDGVVRLERNPNDITITYINDEKAYWLANVKTYKMWYIGDSDKLQDFYMGANLSDYLKNVIANRNKRQMFWSIAKGEMFKKVHTGIANSIINTMSNIVGVPTITDDGVWDAVEKKINFKRMLSQEGRPLSLACGDGAYKINFNLEKDDLPTWEFYEAEDVDFIFDNGVRVGIVYKTYYDYEDEKYVLYETRFIMKGNSYIDYQLFKLENKSNEMRPVVLSTIPALNKLEPVVVFGLNRILGVPSIYFIDPTDKKRGRSVLTGKIDLLDMADEIMSQASQTNRVSSPVEYYHADAMRRDEKGQPIKPKTYAREFIPIDGLPNGDGIVNGPLILTTQPRLDFDKYGNLLQDVKENIYSGFISPSSMGEGLSKKDNAEAQREKEKQTIMTRDNIMFSEEPMIRDIVELTNICYCLMHGIKIPEEFKIEIKYDEFAMPTFESELDVLGKAWRDGYLPTKDYVSLLWKDIPDEEKEEKIKWLDETRNKEQFDLSDYLDDKGTTNSL